MQIANFVNDNTDIIVASIFLDMKEVSVYTVYHLVINGIKKLITRISVGAESALGNLKAESNDEKLKNNFLVFEFVLNFICSFTFSCLIILIVPFVRVYTKGVTDADYVRYGFAIVACLAQLFYCLRLSYTFMVQATGSFFETKKYFYIEAVINIVSSIIFVRHIGLVGIVLGTLFAMIYRTIVFAYFVYKQIIKFSISNYWRRMLITGVCIFINSFVGLYFVMKIEVTNYIEWFIVAIIVSAITLFTTGIIYFLQERTMVVKVANTFFKKIRKNRMVNNGDVD